MECEQCGRSFISRDAMEQHVKSKHPETVPKFRLKPMHIGFIAAILIIGGVGYAMSSYNSTPEEYDAFAQCISSDGTTFYGAYWCTHCNDQKKMFGKSAKYLPYVECSLPNGEGQTAVCEQADIESYPTWAFSDGSRLTGAISLEELSSKTGCAIDETA